MIATASFERFNTDDAGDVRRLLEKKPSGPMYREVRPRSTPYGDFPGAIPMDAVPDVLIRPDQYVDALKEAHLRQTLPMYICKDQFLKDGFASYQNGLNLCWTWSGGAGVMIVRMQEGKKLIIVAPVSMGYLVNWMNRGNYLESFINGAMQDGICEAYPQYGFNDKRLTASLWPKDEKRKLIRLKQVWDTNKASMAQHCVSGLVYGRPGYIAYNWWGHALVLVGIIIREDGVWDWIILNSHGEKDFIILNGSKAIPDECYFFISTVTTLAA